MAANMLRDGKVRAVKQMVKGMKQYWPVYLGAAHPEQWKKTRSLAEEFAIAEEARIRAALEAALAAKQQEEKPDQLPTAKAGA